MMRRDAANAGTNRFLKRYIVVGLVFIVFYIRCDDRIELRRTAASEWKTMIFSAEGMKATVPRASKVDHDPSFGVSVRLHPAAPPWFKLEDTRYYVTIHAERMKRQTFLERKAALESDVKRTPENEWRFWMVEEHPVVAAQHISEYSYYRYDPKCQGDALISANAEVRHPVVGGVLKFQEDDDRIVRRILQSITCLPVS